MEVRIGRSTYTVNENISDDSLALLVCVISSDVTTGFTVTLSTQSGTAIGNHIYFFINFNYANAHITASYM